MNKLWILSVLEFLVLVGLVLGVIQGFYFLIPSVLSGYAGMILLGVVQNKSKPFFRYCKCGKRFVPKGKFTKLCDDCYRQSRSANLIKLVSFNKNIPYKEAEKLIYNGRR